MKLVALLCLIALTMCAGALTYHVVHPPVTPTPDPCAGIAPGLGAGSCSTPAPF